MVLQAWTASSPYERLDEVSHAGSDWVTLEQTTGVEPGTGWPWLKVPMLQEGGIMTGDLSLGGNDLTTGTLTVGSTGTVVKVIAKSTALGVDVPSINGGATGYVDISYPDAAVGDIAVVTLPTEVSQSGLFLTTVRCDTGKITLEFHNPTGAPINPASANVIVLFFDLT